MATIPSQSEYVDHETEDSFGEFSHVTLRWLGSLKFTVTLFALSLIIVLVGTLAQDEMNMLEVKQRYFLSWIAPLHLDDFVPQAFYRHSTPLPGVIPFPGGALIGLLLMVNLIAAKITRFKINASGSKLMLGIGFFIAGLIATGFVVMAGHNSDGLQGTPPISYDALWVCVLVSTGLIAAGFVVAGTQVRNAKLAMLMYQIGGLIALTLVLGLIYGFRIGDPGLRIVWQLTKGLGVGGLLLAGCLLVFKKQGGNVLLHLGVGLLMVGQFAFGDRQLEQRLSLVEGESTNTLINLDVAELTFIERLDGVDQVIGIPGSRLQQAADSDAVIQDEALPVNVKVIEFFPNSTLKKADKDGNIATAGIGLEVKAVSLTKAGGTDGAINVPSAYVELIDKTSGESISTHLVSQVISDRQMLVPGETVKDEFDSVTVNDKSYDIGLRFHREVKPYWVQLEDVRRVNYSGSDTPRDYSSFIRIIDTETGEDRKDRVWMNNPLRYRGETFYQSNYTPLPGGKEMTGIQVVRNSGWLIPYVACSITALGMLVHFLGTLTRFLDRRERENRKELAALAEFNQSPPSKWPVFATVGGLAGIALMMLIPWPAVMNSMRPSERMKQFDFYSAGKIPTQFGGRVMPLDAYARQTLKAISNRESLSLASAPVEIKARVSGKSLSAMQWLMEVAVDDTHLHDLPMFRIDAEEVRSELGLERRKSKLFSLNEIREHWDAASKLVEAASKKESLHQSFKEKKLIELDRRTRQYTLTAAAFRIPTPSRFPASFFPDGTDEQTQQLFALRELEMRMESLAKMPAPAIVPPAEQTASEAVDDPRWSAYAPAFFEMAKNTFGTDIPPRPGIESFGQMIKTYDQQDTVGFNTAVDDHLAAVQGYTIPGYDKGMVSLERWMQSNWPTGVTMFLYLVSTVLALFYFLFHLPRMRQAVWGTLAIALAIHTFTILCRIVITGRAPVINLYSSAVFIGWAAVLFGLVVERIFKYGTGNLLSATGGMLSLLVAYGLNSGDTMPVLQAVLDTQFWLATHVISVTLGYVATLVAGTIGIGYLIAGWVGKDAKMMKDLYRMCYGAACFGILFSFVGTVLGGLWADDSWGRFWGWDPKENGALLIVIWNALMLHARWDGMVKARGFCVLAIGGNIVTAWSWFGTNELGIGLHSYGFTSGVLMWLSLYIASQAAFIAAGVAFGRKPSDLESA
ncbi:Cytochrome c biogenesis protein CcsA [Novipirellula galeiformis]|uniref:Cytochrome c biogenesis protein CcsA n=1 Tax=Novipirellula galeiformis TaxID=2528004 RepID=A0A5C6CSQ0_9BACT|nr:cytochrome c biogenesis protein CcsA [Novipirellula galeiformis]TWU26451.1 Cytochrome c biogenesis protein CcsA [Novipirellula galeiformis]